MVPARSTQHPYATGWSRQDRYSYDWAGFRARDQPALVPGGRPLADRRLGRLRPGPGPRHLAAGPAAHAGGRPRRAAGAAPGRAGRPARRPLGRPPAARAGHARRPRSWPAAPRADGELALEWTSTLPGAAEAAGSDLALAWSAGQLAAAARRAAPSGSRAARSGCARRCPTPSCWGRWPRRHRGRARRRAVEWDLYVRPGRPRIRVAFAPDAARVHYADRKPGDRRGADQVRQRRASCGAARCR